MAKDLLIPEETRCNDYHCNISGWCARNKQLVIDHVNGVKANNVVDFGGRMHKTCKHFINIDLEVLDKIDRNTELYPNIVRTDKRISDIKVGDTVEYRGELLTVGKNDIKSSFMGYSFRGDASIKIITFVQFAAITA